MLGYRTFFNLVSKNIHRGTYVTSSMINLQNKSQLHIGLCSRLASDRALTPAHSAATTTDILLEQLQKSKSAERVMELVSLHHSVMNNRQLASAFQQLYSFAKDNEISEDITNDPNFISLCNWSIKRARFFEAEEIIVVIRTLSYVGILSSSAIMQTMFQMLRHEINNLSLSQIIFVNFLLSKQKSTPLVDAFRMALPLVLQAQIDLQIDSDKLTEVVHCLSMLTTSNLLNSSTFERLIEILHKKHGFLTPALAYKVSTSLLHLDELPDNALELLKLTLHIIAQNVHEIKYKQLISLLIFMQRQNIPNYSLFEAISKKAISERWDFQDLYSLIRSFHSFQYISMEMLDFLSELIINQPKLVLTDKVSILTLAEAFSQPGYFPHQAENVWEIIASSEEKINFLKNHLPSLVVRLISCLAILGCYSPKLLSEFLTEEFLTEAFHSCQKKGRTVQFFKDLLHIKWALQTEDLNCGNAIPSNFLKQAIQLESENQAEISAIEKCFEIGLGGPQFLEKNVLTKYGHRLDYVVVMRKGNYPMAVTFREQDDTTEDNMQLCEIKYAEDIVHPDDAKIVAIIIADEDCFCKHPPMMKGWMKLKLQTLSKLGYYPLLINFDSWNRLLDRERIPYLMREIKDISQNDVTEGVPAI